MEGLLRDARHAVRMIRTKPGFSAAVLLSLALGIGANTAIFSVLNAVLIRPLPYPGSDALVGVFNRLVIQGQVFEDAELSARHVRRRQGERPGLRKFRRLDSRRRHGDRDGRSRATGDGRLRRKAFCPRWAYRRTSADGSRVEDDTPGSPQTVILSYGYWQRKFGGDREVLGRTMVIDLVPHQVIGVMPRDFRLVNVAPDMLLPQRFPKSRLGPDEFSYTGIARLKPGVTIALANQDLARVWKTWAETDGEWPKRSRCFHIKPNLRPLKKDVVGDVGSVLERSDGSAGAGAVAGLRERREPRARAGAIPAAGVCDSRGAWARVGEGSRGNCWWRV